MKYIYFFLLSSGIFMPAMADTTISAESQGTATAVGSTTLVAGAYNNLELTITFNDSTVLPSCINWNAILTCATGEDTRGSRDNGNPTCRAEPTAKPSFKVFYYSRCNEEYTLSAVLKGVSDNGKNKAELTHKETDVPARAADCSAAVRNPVHVEIAAGGTASSPLITSVTGGGGSLKFKPSATSDDGEYRGQLSDETGQGSVAYTVTDGIWDTDHWTTTLESTQLNFKAPVNSRPGDATGNLTAEITCE